MAFVDRVQDLSSARTCDALRLAGGQPMGIPSHCSREVAMLTTDQALPILDDESLEGVVAEPTPNKCR
jgi:hypothetical protein